MSVHPHACGEHNNEMREPTRPPGSSPRLWGTQHAGDPATGRERFIPTPVGNTCGFRGGAGVGTVHPHACGEHQPRGCHSGALNGSSPRLWGTPATRVPFRRVERFIPTPVGNTATISGRAFPAPVHPHACGEHTHGYESARTKVGSSPRLWGTHGTE